MIDLTKTSVVCTVCGHAQAQGDLCDECGLPLTQQRRASATATDGRRQRDRLLADADDERQVRCHQCGTRTSAERCPGCGIPVRHTDEV